MNHKLPKIKSLPLYAGLWLHTWKPKAFFSVFTYHGPELKQRQKFVSPVWKGRSGTYGSVGRPSNQSYGTSTSTSLSLRLKFVCRISKPKLSVRIRSTSEVYAADVNKPTVFCLQIGFFFCSHLPTTAGL